MYSNIYNIYSNTCIFDSGCENIYYVTPLNQNIVLKTESSPADQSVMKSPMS